jgi:hypothetical protein
MPGDMPSIFSSASQSTAYGLGGIGVANNLFATGNMSQFAAETQREADVSTLLRERRHKNPILQMSQQAQEVPVSRRLVRVFIADPNENIPLDQCLLYSGPQKLTDLNDQELFFEIDIRSILEKHNQSRVTVVDKEVKERTEYLEPAKIRDLKMVVVTDATF